MKKILVFVLGIFAIWSCTPKPKNPGSGMAFFQGSLEQAIAEGNKQSKPIFIYGYTDWCGYCKKMSKSTFMEKEVNDFMNENYISISSDMEKGEGLSIAAKYGINSYPSYVILDSNGEIFDQRGGYLGADKFLQWVKVKP
jgi:thioredoxin-related protein